MESGAPIGGTLGPVAAARLRALAEEIARLETERMGLLVLVAEAQGYAPAEGTRFAWDLGADPPTWRATAPTEP